MLKVYPEHKALDHIRRPVPCGRCVDCQIRRRNDWTFRLLQEERISKSSIFATLTYEDDQIPFDKETGETILQKRHLQLFHKQLRKQGHQFKFFAIGEYGPSTLRPHYHGVYFNISPDNIAKKWEKGFTKIAPVNRARLHYVTGYVTEKQSYGYFKKQYKPFALMSNGIGANYLSIGTEHHKTQITDKIYYPGGVPGVLPRYLKEKIFNETELNIISEQNQLIASEEKTPEEIEAMKNRLKTLKDRQQRKFKSKTF